MDSEPALMGGGAATEGAIGAAVGAATTGCVNAVGAWAICAASAGGAAAAAAWAVSNEGVAAEPASAMGLPNGGAAEWTGLVAALEIASALADIGAPVWLPALKLWARSVGAGAAGACGALMGLPAEEAVDAAGASMLGGVVVARDDPEKSGAVVLLAVGTPRFCTGAAVEDPIDPPLTTPGAVIPGVPDVKVCSGVAEPTGFSGVVPSPGATGWVCSGVADPIGLCGTVDWLGVEDTCSGVAERGLLEPCSGVAEPAEFSGDRASPVVLELCSGVAEFPTCSGVELGLFPVVEFDEA